MPSTHPSRPLAAARHLVLGLAVLGCALAPRLGCAATWTGGGASDAWSDPANWQENAVPSAPDDRLHFIGERRRTPVNDLPPGTRFGQLRIGDGFTISGNALVLGRGLQLRPGAMTVACPLAFPEGGLVKGEEGAALVLSGPLALSGALAVMGPGDVSITGVVSGPGGIDLRGPGLLVLSGRNSYTGFTVARGGILRLAAPVVPRADGACGNSTQPLALDGGATIQIATDTVARPINVGGNGGRIDAFGSARTLSGALSLAASAEHPLQLGGIHAAGAGGQELTIGGPVQGDGGVTKSGDSVLRLAHANAWKGPTRILGGTVACAVAGALPEGRWSIARGALLQLGGFDQRVATLDGAGAIELGTARLTLGSSGADSEFAGAISGAGGLTKVGAGTTGLLGPVTCEGGLTVHSGQLPLGRSPRALALRAPLTTVLPLPMPADGGGAGLVVSAVIEVPADAPADLGVGAFVSDRHGRWFQRCHPVPLRPGRNVLRFGLGPDDVLRSEQQTTRWGPAAAAITAQAGLFFWSTATSSVDLRVQAELLPSPSVVAEGHRLLDLDLPGSAPDGSSVQLRTGERWQLAFRPHPFPADPYDHDRFLVEALITAPDGVESVIPGFYDQPMRAGDRGDREQLTPAGDDRFVVRFRPRQSGRHQLRLRTTWGDQAMVVTSLPDLVATGEAWDDYVRTDKTDPRFFAVGDQLYWPVGLNIRSVNDVRSRDNLGTKITPDRGASSYVAYLDRLAAAGGNAVEIWMAAWNLGLEWRGDWYGFHGPGRYNQENAWRLDQVLDAAHRRGIRVNLVINNHGMGSDDCDAEWDNNPYNQARGGRCARARDFFTDPWAKAGQERYRRYLVARYADHPAILGWKLWSEINLTAAGEATFAWHEHAAQRWHELDAYDHGVTTHWSGDYRSPDRRVVALPGLDYICIDAYHGGNLLAQLVHDSTLDPRPGSGLAQFGKPILVTECGGSSAGAPHKQLVAEQGSAQWAALVSGHAGSPMLWWYEWVDQRERWQPYRAITNFIAGEDLRGAEAKSVVLEASSPAGGLWARAWARPGRLLGYVLDEQWGRNGQRESEHAGARIAIGSQVGPGDMTVEWWDADSGVLLKTETVGHAGGALMLSPPPFKRQLAFKMYRGPGAAAAAGGAVRFKG